ncbi:MAG: PilZ domain-containing protein [Candidatus Omnitrophica bacterium]|nr:PilZ domain-containing protein [Candidatus Omnitrophota bacterium]
MKEQRGYVRLDVDAHARYLIKGNNDAPDMVSLEDVGCKGIRIISNKKLTEKDVLDLALTIPGVEGDIILEGKVVWQRQVTMDLLDTGIQFTYIDDANREKLFCFIEESTGRTVERREYVRCDFNAEIKYNLLDHPEVKKQCTSVDVCALGLKVMASEHLEKGTLLRVEFSLPGRAEKIIAKCTVVAWVKKNEQSLFETGIEFLEISDAAKQEIEKYVEAKYKDNK